MWYRSRWSEQTTATLDTAVETANTFEGYVSKMLAARRRRWARCSATCTLTPPIATAF